MAKEFSSLKAKLKKAEPEIKLYVFELEKENRRLQTQIAKYQVKQMGLDSRIKSLEKEVAKQAEKPGFMVVVQKFAEQKT